MENTEEIKSEMVQDVPPEIYTLPDGRKVSIGKYDLDFFGKLQQLPTSVKIAMMRITEDQIKDYLFLQEMERKEKLLGYFKKEWSWMVDDERVLFDDPDNNENYFGIRKNEKQIKAAIKAGKLTDLQIEKITKFFEGVNSEVKFKE